MKVIIPHIDSFKICSKSAIAIIALLVHVSCEDVFQYSTRIMVQNNTAINIATGIYYQSESWAKIGKPDNEFLEFLDGTGHNDINGIPTHIHYLNEANYEEWFAFYKTDTLSVLVASSAYNIKKWKETHNSSYLLTHYSLTLSDFGANDQEYKIVYQPSPYCYVRIKDNPHVLLAVGLLFHSPHCRNYLGVEGTEFFSIIGEGWKDSDFDCPFGWGCESFGEFYRRFELDALYVLLAESESQLEEWNEKRDDSILLKKYKFTLQDFEQDENIKSISLSN